MKLIARLALLSLVLFTPYVRGDVGTPDAFLGRWVLDAKASKYPGNTCPKAMTIEMTREPRGIHYHSYTQPGVGDAFEVDYIAEYDGKPVMVTGSKGILLPVSLERKGAEVIATYRNAFQIVATSRRVLSADGSVMTITTVSHDANGTAVTNVGVYRKAPQKGSGE